MDGGGGGKEGGWASMTRELPHLVHVLRHLRLYLTHSPLREDGPDHPVVGSAMSAVGGWGIITRSAGKAVASRRMSHPSSGGKVGEGRGGRGLAGSICGRPRDPPGCRGPESARGAPAPSLRGSKGEDGLQGQLLACAVLVLAVVRWEE